MKTCKATYIGATIRRSGRSVIVHGQHVLLRGIDAQGRASISYDPSDQTHEGCYFSTLTVFTGVRIGDLVPR